MRYMMEKHPDARATFWLRQIVNIILAVALFFGIASIWLDSPAHLTTAMGLLSAGLAFALQKPISALAGYLVNLRGRAFHVGGGRHRIASAAYDVVSFPSVRVRRATEE